MGNGIVCRYQRICIGEEDVPSNNTIQSYAKPKSKSTTNCIRKNNVDNTPKTPMTTSIIEPKPHPSHLSSKEAYHNFITILNKIIIIQRNYRKYIYKLKHNNNNTKDYPSLFTIEYPINDEANVSISKKAISNVHKSNTSIFSRTLSSMSGGDSNTESSQKGYFLKKKCKYRYQGGLMNSKKVGFGKVTWEDGSVLEATFENSRAQGYCKFIDSVNHSSFSGMYDNNKPCGYGVCVLINSNVKYEGFWCKNYQIGIGLEVWDDESYYQGEYANSKKKGIGLYRWSDGTIYKGEWSDNKMNGYGVIHYSDDRVYMGQVENGEINGFGMFMWKDGGRYIGNYVKEQKQGFGAFIWNKKPVSAYVGFWLDGKQNGVGLKISNQSCKYGIWKDGRLDITLQGHWVIRQHLKPDQLKYEQFLGKSIAVILKLFNPL